MKAVSGKKYTAQELAEQFGCSVKTIHNHANALFGERKQGFKKARLFDEAQVTAILEHIKAGNNTGGVAVKDVPRLKDNLQTTETAILERIKTPVSSGRKATTELNSADIETALSLRKNSEAVVQTIREVTGVLGCSPETIKGHIRELWPNLMQNGIATYLTEAQVTVILERMKASGGQRMSEDLQNNICRLETNGSRVARIAMQLKIIDEAHRSIEAEMQAEIDDLNAEKTRLEAAYGREVWDHKATRALLDERGTGLETYQRVAEAAGLTISDQDDVCNTYRRKRY